jgi:hypothetical protein
MILPRDTDYCAGVLGLVPDQQFYVFLACGWWQAGPHLLRHARRPDVPCAWIDHAAGRSWPDNYGQTVTRETLAVRGFVIWQFATEADCRRAHARVQDMTGAVRH